MKSHPRPPSRRLPLLFLPAAALLLLLLAPLPAAAFTLRLPGDAASTNALVIPPTDAFSDEALCIAPAIRCAGVGERDLWLLAQSVDFTGTALQDFRVCASSVTLSSIVSQNAAIGAKAAALSTNSVIQGDLLLCAQTAVLEGIVGGESRIIANTVTLSGTFNSTVRVSAANLSLSPSLVVNGDLVCDTPDLPVPPPGARILGKIRHTPAAPPVSPWDAFRARLFLHGVFYLGAILVGIPFVALFPLAAGNAVRSIRLHPWRSLLSGALTLFLAPSVCALLFVTVIGIPLALVALLFLLLLLYLSHIVVALCIGHFFTGRGRPQTLPLVLRSLAIGLFCIYFFSAIPPLSSWIVLPVVVLGLGALCQALRHPVIFARAPFPPPVPPPVPPSP